MRDGTHCRYQSILSISFKRGRRLGSTVKMLNTSCDTADSSGEPNLRHGSWAKMLPSRKAQNSGLFWVGSSQGVSARDEGRHGWRIFFFFFFFPVSSRQAHGRRGESRKGRRRTAKEESKEDDPGTPDVDRFGRIRLRSCQFRCSWGDGTQAKWEVQHFLAPSGQRREGRQDGPTYRKEDCRTGL